MNAGILIQRLRSIGYRIRTDGKDILLNADREPPNPEMVICLLTELRKYKAEVMNILQMGATITPTEKSQQPASVKVSWPPELQSLINWFISTDPPPEPFYLQDHLHVRDPAKFFGMLRHEVEVGPRGPRARTGALQSDLRNLKNKLH